MNKLMAAFALSTAIVSGGEAMAQSYSQQQDNRSASSDRYDYYADQDQAYREQQQRRVETRDERDQREYEQAYNRSYNESNSQYRGGRYAYPDSRDSRNWQERNLGSCSAFNGRSLNNRGQAGVDRLLGRGVREFADDFNLDRGSRIADQQAQCLRDRVHPDQRARVEGEYRGNQRARDEQNFRNWFSRDVLGIRR